MKILVAIKRVQDYNVKVRPKSDGSDVDIEGIKMGINPFDENALEEALRLKEKELASEITVVSIGDEKNQDVLRHGLAMGADSAILVSDDALAGTDALGTAKILAAAIERVAADLVLTATESSDGYTGSVPEQVAELLGLPSVTFAKEVTVDGGNVAVNRQTEDGYDDVACPLPALVSVTAGVVEPRYPSFKGIMAAKSKPVEELALADLGIEAGSVGWAGGGQEIVSIEPAPAREAGEIIEDEGDGHERIMSFLQELKVI